MAIFNKFYQFPEDLAKKVHNLNVDTVKILLTNTAPNVADTVVDTTTTPCTIKATSNAVETAAGNGYLKGGNTAAFSSGAQTSGVYKLVLSDPATWTANPSAMAPFRYAVMYNDTAGTTATRPLIGFWDYGSTVTPAVGETFTVDLDPGTGVLTITVS